MRPDTYKAAIYRGVGKVEVVDLPYPPCGDDEAIVRNVLTGIAAQTSLLSRSTARKAGFGLTRNSATRQSARWSNSARM